MLVGSKQIALVRRPSPHRHWHGRAKGWQGEGRGEGREGREAGLTLHFVLGVNRENLWNAVGTGPRPIPAGSRVTLTSAPPPPATPRHAANKSYKCRRQLRLVLCPLPFWHCSAWPHVPRYCLVIAFIAVVASHQLTLGLGTSLLRMSQSARYVVNF